ncbi:DUF1700 domain-containing protein [Paenibacillus tuaregi]|uniref:DUF1700 domain-containing protein n=1 Tax=Paenibacillus tuaregi TaxID=1816681 RepID=UPI0008391B2B|nr:DUF1700 domain-containing protein [Paenibacillus tuaregi]
MNKNEFLTLLNTQLSQLPPEEKLELLEDYEAHFAFGKQNGKTEEEIVHELGDPHELAKEALGERFTSREPVYWYHDPSRRPEASAPPAPARRRRGATAQTFVIIGMFFINLVLAPLMLAFWTFAAAITIGAVACIASPVLLTMDMLYNEVSTAKWFASVFMVGIGILLALASKGLFRAVLISTQKYFSWNHQTAKGDA